MGVRSDLAPSDEGAVGRSRLRERSLLVGKARLFLTHSEFFSSDLTATSLVRTRSRSSARSYYPAPTGAPERV